MSLADNIKNRILRGLQSEEPASNETLNNALRLLAKWRSVLIQNTLIKNSGVRVQEGPFEGLQFVQSSAEGCHIAKLLGCYEQPLHKYVKNIIDQNYESVINIGCAEGYYAVGLAVAMPGVKSYAYDIDKKARDTCKELAKKNGVSERVIVGEEFTHADFKRHAHEKTIIFCDIEGAELELLDPELSTYLQMMDIVVEAHECIRPGVTKILCDRFRHSHDIEIVEDNGLRSLQKQPAWFNQLAHLDQILATWEWRAGPTPWLILKAKN